MGVIEETDDAFLFRADSPLLICPKIASDEVLAHPSQNISSTLALVKLELAVLDCPRNLSNNGFRGRVDHRPGF